MTREVLTGGRIVTPVGVLDPGYVVVEGSRIANVGEGRPATGGSAVRHLNGRWLIPGLIDVHVHGGGGGELTSPDSEAHARAAEFHARHGTTALLATTVTSPAEHLRETVSALGRAVSSPHPGARILGIHLEGPFISERRRGAQNGRWIRDPDPEELQGLVDASAGTIRMLTIAPERPGASEVIKLAVANGIVAAAGHSDASYDELVASVAWGITHCIHTYNGMRGLHHRDPGLVGGLLDLEELTCELIADGLHVHPAAARLLHRVKGSEKLLLITDAIAAAGMPDGTYELGGMSIRVSEGRAETEPDGSLAGSTLTMGAALRKSVEMLGVDLVEAVHMASTTPARLLGLEGEIGTISEHSRADLVVLDDDLQVEATMVGGIWF